MKPLGYNVGIAKSFWAVMVGYLANLAFPRMGEVTKCGVLKRTDGVKISASMGTVVTERIFDVLSLLTILSITFLIEFDRLNQFFINLFEEKLSKININVPLIVMVGLFLILVVGFLIMKFKKQIMHLPLYEKLLHFKEGILSIRRIENIPAFFLSTIGIWVLYYFMSYIIVFSIPETSELDWIAGMAILVVGGIAMSAPVQGGIGTYHLLVAALLTLYGIKQEEGVFFATILHTSQTLSVLFLGSIGLIVVSLSKKPLNGKNET